MHLQKNSLVESLFRQEVVDVTQRLGMRAHNEWVGVALVEKVAHAVSRQQSNTVELVSHYTAVETYTNYEKMFLRL